jgi:ATP/maltotriose-dependent transcriptional regulator MalT
MASVQAFSSIPLFTGPISVHLATATLLVKYGRHLASTHEFSVRLEILRRMCSASSGTTLTPAASAVTLTQREIEILQLVAKGLSNNEIAESLKISTHTVVTHFKKTYSKLGVHSRSEAVYEAGQLGIL